VPAIVSSPAEYFDPPVEVLRPARQTLPVVLASPHSGRDYPESFLRQVRLRLGALRRSEDGYVDELFRPAVQVGVPMIRALFPRAVIDVNREPFELDPTMFSGPLPGYAHIESARVRSGLGTIARVAASGAEIYRGPLAYADARARLRRLYMPYHKMLRGLIAETRARFGMALLIDCHSMPSQATNARGGARARAPTGIDVVLGDCHGRSCDPTTTAGAEKLIEALGYSVTRNSPYAGGFTTRYYGRPTLGVQALQIEVNRALYMDEQRLTPRPALDEHADDLARWIEGMGALMLEQGATASAAE